MTHLLVTKLNIHLKSFVKNFVVSDTATNNAALAINDLTIVGPKPE